MLTSLQRVEAAVEGDEVFGPQAAHHLDLLGLPRAARLPRGTERLIFDMVPADADAEAQPPAAQDIDFGCLLGDEAGLALRQDQHAAAQLDVLVTAARKAIVVKVSWNGSCSL